MCTRIRRHPSLTFPSPCLSILPPRITCKLSPSRQPSIQNRSSRSSLNAALLRSWPACITRTLRQKCQLLQSRKENRNFLLNRRPAVVSVPSFSNPSLAHLANISRTPRCSRIATLSTSPHRSTLVAPPVQAYIRLSFDFHRLGSFFGRNSHDTADSPRCRLLRTASSTMSDSLIRRSVPPQSFLHLATSPCCPPSRSVHPG